MALSMSIMLRQIMCWFKDHCRRQQDIPVSGRILEESRIEGVELQISSDNLTGQLRWSTDFVFSLNRDKITKLYGGGQDEDIGNSWFVGEPISAIYDYEMVDGTVWTEADLYSGNILSGWYPGQFKLVDQNNDGTIDPTNDRTIVGYSTPLYRFSIRNTLSYKNFTLTFFINSVQGGKNHYLGNSSEL